MKKPIQVVIPMAGFGSRLRPLTWSKPKPLVAIAGKTSLDYLIDEFSELNQDFEVEYIFIISPNGWAIKDHMQAFYPQVKCDYVVQEEMKGQSHAILLAKELIHGPMLMSFSDTLMDGDLAFLTDAQLDGIAWVQKNEHPQRFGAAVPDESGHVKKIIEKPPTDEYKMVVVGFYYFKEGQDLIKAIEEQIRENISLKNEFYIADAINIMLKNGAVFGMKETKLWVDTGVRETVISTNRHFLENGADNSKTAKERPGVVLVPPVYVADSAVIERSVIGPYVSVADDCEIRGCVIENSIIDKNTKMENQVIKDSMIGTKATLKETAKTYFLGDNSIIE